MQTLFSKSTIEVAKSLLGMKLKTRINGKVTSGMIVEVEAYHQDKDRASHAYNGKVTRRNEIMFQKAGLCYVYLIYGMYYCVNVVTEGQGVGAAVLIRAIKPLEGLEVMSRRRGLPSDSPELTNGPGKLCRALAITTKLTGQDMTNSRQIWLEPYRSFWINKSPHRKESEYRNLNICYGDFFCQIPIENPGMPQWCLGKRQFFITRRSRWTRRGMISVPSRPSRPSR